MLKLTSTDTHDEQRERDRARVGFSLEEFKPTHSSDDAWSKLLVIGFTVFTLFWPIIFVQVKLQKVVPFWFGATAVIVANGIITLVLLIRLWSIHEQWTKAAERIGVMNGYNACKGVQSAFEMFRRLMKWNLFFKYTGIWTTFLYLTLIGQRVT